MSSHSRLLARRSSFRLRRVTALLPILALCVTASAAAQSTRAVLVTGASTGIGRTITEHLAARGYFVYAGARSAEDLAALSRLPNVQGVRLDVTVPAEIDSAVALVRRAGRGLHGVVNNAGIAAFAPLVEMSDRDMSALLDVNVMGPFRVTRAFAPLLMESQGRVVLISSISGTLSGALLGGYSMSKHAVEAYGDALAAEVARFGMQVSLVEPGNFRSSIGRTTRAQIERFVAEHPASPYRAQMQNLIGAMDNYDRYPVPEPVAEAVAHALGDSAPRRRYMVTAVARESEVTLRKAVDELVQLNQWGAFRFDRDALVRLLDSSLVRHP